MVGPIEISAGLTSLKAALDITKAMKDIHDATVIQGKIFELQRVILEAQESAINAREAHAAQIDRIRSLEAEIAALKEWDAGKGKYELKAVANGAFAYVLKEDTRGSEPEHWLCVNCFDNRKRKSVVQNAGRSQDKHQAIYRCPDCKSEFRTHWNTRPGNANG